MNVVKEKREKKKLEEERWREGVIRELKQKELFYEKKEDSIIKICNLIKIKLGLPLTKEEKVKENEFRK
jgi:hypothetical protein